MFGLGPAELIAILVIVLLLFGARKLPELAKGLGQSAREFRKGMDSEDDKKPEEAKSEPKQG